MAKRRGNPGCEVRYTSDGQPVRVRGSISQELLDELGSAVRRMIDSRCDHEGPFIMPAVARRAHGRDHYACGREQGHEGEHRWPPRDEARWRWLDDGTPLTDPSPYTLDTP